MPRLAPPGLAHAGLVLLLALLLPPAGAQGQQLAPPSLVSTEASAGITEGAPLAAVQFATYLGGTALDAGQAVALDAEGNLYVAGHTQSGDFPTTTATPYRAGLLGLDVYVAKLSPEGALVWATYLGGSGDEMATALAVDEAGRVYVGGGTTSADFPTTPDAVHGFRGGDRLGADGFLARLSPDGTVVEYATYLGGTDDDAVAAVALGPDGQVYVAGATCSDDFPVTPGAFQATYAGGELLRTDAFVARFRLSDTALALDFATYLGGSLDDKAAGLAADADGRAYVTGLTGSGDFPLARPLQPSYAGPLRELQGDAYVARLTPDGTTLDFATYLGGREDDEPTALALAPDGAVYVTGWTQSRDFPATPGAVQPARRGPQDAFLVRLEPAATGPWALAWATFLGGTGTDQAFALAVDAGGQALVGGGTTSADFPTEAAVQPTASGGLDAFVALVAADGTMLRQSTYLGGDGPDVLTGLTVNGTDRVCATGGTGSADFPTLQALRAGPTGAAGTPGFLESAFVACLRDAASGVDREAPLDQPAAVALRLDGPNPFRTATRLRFEVPRPAHVQLAVYDVRGRRVATLVDAAHAPGRYAAHLDATGWPSGVYLARLDAAGTRAVHLLTLIR